MFKDAVPFPLLSTDQEFSFGLERTVVVIPSANFVDSSGCPPPSFETPPPP